MNHNSETPRQGNEHQRNGDLSKPGAANPFNKNQPADAEIDEVGNPADSESEQTFKEAQTERD